MKKILTILSIGALATMSYGQGTIVVSSTAGAFAMYTNSAVGVNFGGTGLGGTSAKTPTWANGQFYYALLIQAYTGGGVVDNPNSANGWTQALLSNAITNSSIATGGVNGPGGTTVSGAAVSNWAAPTGGGASQGGTEEYYMLVGWSGNLGSDWTTVYDDIVNNSWGSTENYVGWSAVGYGFSGGGVNSVPAPSIFGVTAAEPGGFASGFTLFATPVPEPSVIMLAGLGGLSLLLFRRRK